MICIRKNHSIPSPLLILLLLSLCSTFFVKCNTDVKPEQANEQDFEALGLHYGKYLKEVVEALDKDQKFTETIKNMDANDIKSGKVAEQLKHVHEDVRKKLNDLKYLEIKRLRDLASRKNEMEQFNGETYHGSDKRKWRTLGASLSQLPDHLGSHGIHFDMNDLHKLMVAATNDLEKIDKERKEDFKTYEMEKEWQFNERIKMMNETEKQEAIRQRQKLKEKHDEHPRVLEPGSKAQLEEVWEKEGFQKNEFNPKTFFALHDTNSDNHWDQQEVRQLLAIEINKLYDPNNPEDDPNEMEEEYERMREHVYKEIDADKDGLISQKEFLDYSQKPEFKTEHGWDPVTKKEAFTKQDYENYLKHRDEMLRKQHGYYDPAHYANQPADFHLPNYGYGMPHGADPAQYYGYHIDPNHPQAQQMLAQQQHMAYQQHPAAYQQQAYQQGGVVNQQQYQQPAYQQAGVNNQQYQQPAAPQYQQPAIGNQQQQPPQQYQQPAAPYQQAGVVDHKPYQQPLQQIGQQQNQQQPVQKQAQQPVAQQMQQPLPQQGQQQVPQPGQQPVQQPAQQQQYYQGGAVPQQQAGQPQQQVPK